MQAAANRSAISKKVNPFFKWGVIAAMGISYLAFIPYFFKEKPIITKTHAPVRSFDAAKLSLYRDVVRELTGMESKQAAALLHDPIILRLSNAVNKDGMPMSLEDYNNEFAGFLRTMINKAYLICRDNKMAAALNVYGTMKDHLITAVQSIMKLRKGDMKNTPSQDQVIENIMRLAGETLQPTLVNNDLSIYRKRFFPEFNK